MFATVLTENVPKFYESGNGKINWHYLPESNEILWFSERNNWGNLYLYDLDHRQAEEPDHARRRAMSPRCSMSTDKTRTIYFVGVGSEKGRDPYLPALLQRELRRHRA